jgi:hypothetical protein
MSTTLLLLFLRITPLEPLAPRPSRLSPKERNILRNQKSVTTTTTTRKPSWTRIHPDQQLLSLKNASIVTGIPVRTLRNALQKPEWPYPFQPVRLAGRWYFRRSEIEKI